MAPSLLTPPGMSGGAAKILVVEDDGETREFYADSLATGGYAVTLARDGAVALSLLAREDSRPDLLLLDLDVPRVDGFSLLAQLRQQPLTLYLPTLVVTGYRGAAVAVACLDGGADDFLAKPVDSGELISRVRRHLNASRRADSWRASSTTDALTGIPNRRAFAEAMDREVSRVARTGCSLSLAFLDLDYFKKVNDQHGHAVGDRVLQRMAIALTATLRRGDLYARWGGDEFVVALPGAERAVALDVVARIRREVREMTRDCLVGPIDVSAGVACMPEDVAADWPMAGARLVDAADRHMFRHKAERGEGHERVAAVAAGGDVG